MGFRPLCCRWSGRSCRRQRWLHHRGGKLTDLGAGRLLGLSHLQEGHEQYLRFVWIFAQGTSVRTDGVTPGRLETCWLTRLLGCNRIWQSSKLKAGCCEHRWSHLWCIPLGRRRSRRLKCHGLVGRPVGNSTNRSLTP